VGAPNLYTRGGPRKHKEGLLKGRGLFPAQNAPMWGAPTSLEKGAPFPPVEKLRKQKGDPGISGDPLDPNLDPCPKKEGKSG